VPSVVEGIVTEYRDGIYDDVEFGVVFSEEFYKKTAKLHRCVRSISCGTRVGHVRKLGRKDRQHALYIGSVEAFAIIRFRNIDCIDIIHRCPLRCKTDNTAA